MMNTAPTYSVKVGNLYLGQNSLSAHVRPMPVRFKWTTSNRALAETAAAEWGGTVLGY